MKIWKKLLQVDRVHLEFIGNASRYIHTHYTYTLLLLLLLLIPYKVLVRMIIKFRITKEKEKEEDTIKQPQQNVLLFRFCTFHSHSRSFHDVK